MTIVAAHCASGAALAQEPQEETPQPAAPPAAEAPADPPLADPRLEALERRLRVVEAQARAAEVRATEANARLDELRREQGAVPTASEPAGEEAAPPPGPRLALDGYVEANYAYNFNRPRNGITDFRGFDNRHNSFTLSNVMLGATFGYQSLIGRLSLQVGHTPTTYYLGEPLSPGGSASGTTDGSVFRYIQEAYVGYRAPVGNGLQLAAGVFVSHIGFEGIAVKDNFNWSRSNLFFGLPFYHTGVKATYEVSDAVSAMFMVSNGWTGVVDNNFWKSVSTQWLFEPVTDVWTLSLVYMGGPERPRGAPERLPDGADWRHLFDLWTQIDATDWLTLALQGDAGFEKNAFGTSSWVAGAAYARVQPLSWLYLGARGDIFHEHAAEDDAGNTASQIFWPADTIGSGTFTADVRPHEQLSFRAEYRHDEATADMFFEGSVAGDGVTTPFVHDARRQDTVTLGVTGWFDMDMQK